MSAMVRVCCAAIFFACTMGLAQQIPAPPSSPNSLTLHVAVTAAHGGAVTGLTPQSFKLLDNKVERPIASVKELQAGSEPVSVLVVVDAVNTGFSRVAYARGQVQQFLKANSGHLAQPTTIAVVTDKGAEIKKGFSTDGNALSQALGQLQIGLREIRRDSGIWGANERVDISLTALRQLIAYSASLPGRKLVLWVSPGWPLLSGSNIDLDNKQRNQIFAQVVSYSQQMRQANVTLYDIDPLGPEENLFRTDFYQSFVKGVSKPDQTDLADLSLQVLAVQSGGLVATGNSDVAGNLEKYSADGAGGYNVTFDMAGAEHANEYHHLQVEVTTPGLTARTRDGYYAQP